MKSELKQFLNKLSEDLEKKKAELEELKSEIEKITPPELMKGIEEVNDLETELETPEVENELDEELKESIKEVKTVEDAKNLLENAKEDIQLVIDNIDALSGQAMEEAQKVSFRRISSNVAEDLKHLAKRSDAVVEQAREIKRYWGGLVRIAKVDVDFENESLRTALQTVKEVGKFAKAFNRIMSSLGIRSTAVPPTNAVYTGDKLLDKLPEQEELKSWEEGNKKFKEYLEKEKERWNPATTDRLKSYSKYLRRFAQESDRNKDDVIGTHTHSKIYVDTRDLYIVDREGYLDSENDIPAVILNTGVVKWYRKGILHRDKGAAVVTADGQFEYWKNGELVKILPRGYYTEVVVKPEHRKRQTKPITIWDLFPEHKDKIDLNNEIIHILTTDIPDFKVPDFNRPFRTFGLDELQIGGDEDVYEDTQQRRKPSGFEDDEEEMKPKQSRKISSIRRKRSKYAQKINKEFSELLDGLKSEIEDKFDIKLSDEVNTFDNLFLSVFQTEQDIDTEELLNTLVEYLDNNIDFKENNDFIKNVVKEVYNFEELAQKVEDGEVSNFKELMEELRTEYSNNEEKLKGDDNIPIEEKINIMILSDLANLTDNILLTPEEIVDAKTIGFDTMDEQSKETDVEEDEDEDVEETEDMEKGEEEMVDEEEDEEEDEEVKKKSSKESDYYTKVYGKEYARKLMETRNNKSDKVNYEPKYKSVNDKKSSVNTDVIKAKMRRAFEVAKKFANLGIISPTKEELSRKTAELYSMSDLEFKAVENTIDSIMGEFAAQQSGIVGNKLRGVSNPMSRVEVEGENPFEADGVIKKGSVVPQVVSDTTNAINLFNTIADKLREKGVDESKLLLPKYRNY